MTPLHCWKLAGMCRICGLFKQTNRMQFAMDAEPFIARILDDEGLTGGLPDDAGQAVIEWAIKATRERVEAASDAATAQEVGRKALESARLAALVAEALIDGEVDKAKSIWRAKGQTESLDSVAGRPPAEIARQLLAWRAKHDA